MSACRGVVFVMSQPDEVLLQRVTQRPGVCGGRACVRETRIRVSDVLEMLAAGESVESILQDFPALNAEDIRACLVFAARRAAHVQVAA